MPADFLPRVLNTQDIPDLRPTDPQPTFAPEGDFDKDGSTDIAISGLYTLKEGKKRYFLLVAGAEGRRFKQLFLEEYETPVFLHRPGSTGEADPGDQAFSATFCIECAQGQDFYWQKSTGRFRQVLWKEKTQRLKKMVQVPAKDVPPEEADKALRLIGGLKDVIDFTTKMSKEGRTFGVRVEYADEKKPSQYRVKIYEKRQGEEKIYDDILVDLEKMVVLHRKTKR